MARGWESKAVKEQLEAAESKKVAGKGSSQRGQRPSRQRESLLLAKTRIVHEIKTTDNPRYRELLESSLHAIEKQLAEIE